MPLRKIVICDGAALPDPSTLAGAIITGSHAMVTDRAGWSEDLARWLRLAIPQQLPVLGICYGHQLLAQALGGTVGPRALGLSFGTIPVIRTPRSDADPLFGKMPATFPAHVIHQQVVMSLPPDTVVLGQSPADPHQILRFAPQVWGVQFHPEFPAAAIDGYAKALDIVPQGDAAAAPSISHVIGRFAALALGEARD